MRCQWVQNATMFRNNLLMLSCVSEPCSPSPWMSGFRARTRQSGVKDFLSGNEADCSTEMVSRIRTYSRTVACCRGCRGCRSERGRHRSGGHRSSGGPAAAAGAARGTCRSAVPRAPTATWSAPDCILFPFLLCAEDLTHARTCPILQAVIVRQQHVWQRMLAVLMN